MEQKEQSLTYWRAIGTVLAYNEIQKRVYLSIKGVNKAFKVFTLRSIQVGSKVALKGQILTYKGWYPYYKVEGVSQINQNKPELFEVVYNTAFCVNNELLVALPYRNFRIGFNTHIPFKASPGMRYKVTTEISLQGQKEKADIIYEVGEVAERITKVQRINKDKSELQLLLDTMESLKK